jgi:hypothetical protein
MNTSTQALVCDELLEERNEHACAPLVGLGKIQIFEIENQPV